MALHPGVSLLPPAGYAQQIERMGLADRTVILRMLMLTPFLCLPGWRQS